MKWLERSWLMEGLEGRYGEIMNRLANTPARIEQLTDGLSNDQLIWKPMGKWSIVENIGHLLTMESLWIGRLDDFVMGNPTLRPWNGTNMDTDSGRFNEQRAGAILADFLSIRDRHVAMLRSLENVAEIKKARHERLQKDFRLLDHVFFIAEHDDHHLRTIRELAKP